MDRVQISQAIGRVTFQQVGQGRAKDLRDIIARVDRRSRHVEDNELDHVTVAFAGGDPLPEMGSIKANVALSGDAISGSGLKISNSIFLESGGYGLYVAGKSLLNYFSGNYFTNNTASALYVPAGQLHRLDFFSHYSDNNGYNGVETGGTVKENSPVTWIYFNDGSKYFVSEDLIIESGVHISEGATFEFATNVSVKVADGGYLTALGTNLNPITFTARIKTADKFWKGMVFNSGHELNSLDHTVISHAGYGMIPEISLKANLAVTGTGKLSVLNSKIEKGLGWGMVALEGAHFNADVVTANTFSELAEGKYKFPYSETITASLAGKWLDLWSFNNHHNDIDPTFYDPSSGTWFMGATDPWNMSTQTGFGLKIDPDGSYLWTIAEHSPSVPECQSYSAEYITGNLQASGDELSFEETYWRSKFYFSCDPEQNVDTEVQPGAMVLRYEINRMYNVFTYEAYWQLKIINPDNTFFTYYKY